MPECVSQSDALVAVFQQYYQIASNSIGARATLIQDDSLREHIQNLSDQPSPQVALYICKLIMCLSDHRKHARLLAENGYIPLVGKYSEQPNLPVKLLAKFVQLQSRLVNAEKSDKPEPKRRTKEMVFLLSVLDGMAQHAISQAILQNIKGMVSVSFKVLDSEKKMQCVVRCLLHIEPKEVAVQIMRCGPEECDYVHQAEGGDAELFTFYRDADEDQHAGLDHLPHYLDENVAVFDPSTAVAAAASASWMHSAKKLFGFW